jgi:hypothetical protein
MSTVTLMRRREHLPPRRRNESTSIEWRGHQLSICAGLARDGNRLLEVFVRANRVESDLDRLADDAAVTLSLLLQHGADLIGIAKALGRPAGGEPGSLIAAVIDALVALEQELQQ